MAAFSSIMMGVLAAATLATTANSLVQSGKDPDVPQPPMPKDAIANDTQAQDDARDAAKRARKSLGASDGRSSTIMSGGKLGEMGTEMSNPKSLLGL